MKPLVIFLNELSCAHSHGSRQVAANFVASAVTALQVAKKQRRDLVLASHLSLKHLPIGDEAVSLVELMQGHREELRFLLNLAASNPWDCIEEHSSRPSDTAEIRHSGNSAVGMTWADHNEALVFSFACDEQWRTPEVPAQRYSVSSDGEAISTDVYVCNISEISHTERWQSKLEEYGLGESKSSRIFSGEGYEVRMYLNDHNPPHLHIQSAESPRLSLGKIRIDTFEMLDRELPPAIKRHLIQWMRGHKEELMASWNRCRKGQHPLLIE